MKNTFIHITISILGFVFFLAIISSKVQAEPYGWSPQVDFSNQGPPVCTDSKPDKAPVLLQPNHPALPKKPKKGEVVLYWHKIPGATGYNIYYGLSPKNYIFSVPDVGDSSNYTIGFLPNKIIYFAVQAKNGCAASALSQEWAVRPGGGGYISSSVLGTFSGSPIRKVITSKSVEKSEGLTIIVPTVSQNNSNPEVKGVQTQQAQPTFQTPVYQPPVNDSANNIPPPAVPVAPAKPKGILQWILSAFGLGK